MMLYYDSSCGLLPAQTWLVLEFCNRGCVADAVSKGWFRKQGSRFEPDLKAILPTAREIAGALSYLHAKNILHGDLTGSNVLLTVTAEGHRGWMAKVGCQQPPGGCTQTALHCVLVAADRSHKADRLRDLEITVTKLCATVMVLWFRSCCTIMESLRCSAAVCRFPTLD